MKTKRTECQEYKIWSGIKQRIFNSKRKDYQKYGAKGITLCDRWLYGDGVKNGFMCFYEDMGPRPTPKHSIDRIDGTKGYCLENCRWATWAEQSRNKISNRFITIDGTTKCVKDWCLLVGVNPSCVLRRLKNGWNEKDAIFTPTESYNFITIDGETKTLSEWSKISHIDRKVIRNRLNNSWQAKKAVFTPSHHKKQIIEFMNKSLSLTEWSKISKIPPRTIHRRIKEGWDIESAIFSPLIPSGYARITHDN